MQKQLRFFEFILSGVGISGLGPKTSGLFKDFAQDLAPSIRFMLLERFEANKRKKTPSPFKNQDLKKLLEKDQKPSQPTRPLSPLHIVKAYKLLEQQLYHGRAFPLEDFQCLELGQFFDSIS
jgi:hypothetical protein